MSTVAGGCLPWVSSPGDSLTLAEYERTFVAQRNQIEALQNQVSGLLHERNFMKASTANDIRTFCLNHLASAGSGTSRDVHSAITTSSNSLPSSSVSSPRSRLGGHGHLGSGSATDVETIPVYDLLMFLYRYTNGLIPPPENKRKRMRSSSTGVGGNGGCSTASGSNSRLLQRMLSRQRLGTGYREEDERKGE